MSKPRSPLELSDALIAGLGWSPGEAALARAALRELSPDPSRLALEFAARGQRAFLFEFLIRPGLLWGLSDERRALRDQERLSFFTAHFTPRQVMHLTPSDRWLGKLGWLALESLPLLGAAIVFFCIGRAFASVEPIPSVCAGLMVSCAIAGPFALPPLLRRWPWADVTRRRLARWIYTPEERRVIRERSFEAASDILSPPRAQQLLERSASSWKRLAGARAPDFELGALIDSARSELVRMGQNPGAGSAEAALALIEREQIELAAARATPVAPTRSL